MAARFLKKQGYKLLEKNWRCSFGEVDLIMRDLLSHPPEGELVFVEVKTRDVLDDDYRPEDAVTPLKLRHLSAVAEAYLKEVCGGEAAFRFDVVAICEPTSGRPGILHLKGV
jgi:putative endonuclease